MIVVDPTLGTTNKYNKSTGAWTYTGLTNYTYFDASDEQVATSHVYMNIYPDYRAGNYIDDEYEMGMLRDFFEQPVGDSYKTRGTVMNSSYSAYDTATWGDGTKSHFMTNGRGKTTQIQWSNKGFTGDLNLPGFTKMSVFSSHGNKYETANLSNSPALKSVYLQNNKLTSVDLSSCYKLSYVRALYNPMKNLTLYVNGQNRTFTAGDNGTFYFTLDTRYTNSSLSLYSKPDIGYKLGGVYSTGTGNRLSTKTTYHFTPKASGYSIRFVLNPDSYKYYLAPGESRSSRLPYIRAAAKRLNELGYYNPNGNSYGYWYGQTAVGEETSYTDELVSAVIKFQVMHDISNTGNVGQQTWSALFSDSAKSMVSDDEYSQILANYEAMKVQRAEATEQMNQLTVKASSTASKGAMNLTWSSSSAVLDIDSVQIDGYELWKSTSKSSDWQLLKSTTGKKFKNTSNIKKGTRYYYKVRAYREIGGQKIYSPWSNVTYKIAK